MGEVEVEVYFKTRDLQKCLWPIVNVAVTAQKAKKFMEWWIIVE